MRSLLFLIAMNFFACSVFSQYVYTIKADTVKITNCDSAELVLQNHTQGVPGFLFNAGNGRTVFQRGAQSIGNGIYLVGADTIRTASNAWVQDGNSFGTTGVLGTRDNNHLDLYTHDTARARLTNSGDFLIGSTNDNGNRLQVSGGVFQDGGVYHKNYYTDLSHASFEMGSGYELYGIPHASGGYVYYLAGGLSGDYDSEWELAIGNSSNKIMEFNSNLIATNQSLRINAGLNLLEQNSYLQSPYVGFQYQDQSGWNWALMNSNNQPNFMVTYLGNTVLGSTTDYGGGKLQVTGNSYFNGNMGVGTAYPTAQLHTTGSVRFAGLTSDSTQTKVIVSDANGNLYLRSVSSLAANDVIRSSLAVNGPIKAMRLTLSPSDWPDYVFDSSYRLPALPDIENYIRQQHHLPGIVSAAQVQKDGADVGDNQAALLKKVEEMTLYIIDQAKKLDEQYKTQEAQKAEIQALKTEVEMLIKSMKKST